MVDTLTDLKIKSLKPKSKPYKVSDGKIGGMFVAVSTVGSKVFRLGYKFQGKAKQLTLCTYPEFSLIEAREMAEAARKQIRQGIDPCAVKKAEKAKRRANELTFRAVAEEWVALRAPGWSPVHVDDVQKILQLHVYPRIGGQPIASVTKADIKAILDTLQAQRKMPTLKKVRSHISQVMRFAMESEIAGVNVDWTTQLRGGQYQMLPTKNRAAITDPRGVKRLINAIESYENTSRVTCIALKFSALTFARPGEIRHAEWKEIDWEAGLWRLPAEKMKMRKPHMVPLAKQTIALLHQLQPLTGHSKYLFPSTRTAERPMSEATITAALRRMDFSKKEMCAHGFRTTASTILNEHGYNRDWIEMQLAHGPRDVIRAAYNHAEFLEGRRDMMQWWANYLFNATEG